MTKDITNAELLAKIEAGFGLLGTEVKTLSAKIDRLDGDMREVKGQLSVAMTWLQSMDQRYMAIMSPYQPPTKKQG